MLLSACRYSLDLLRQSLLILLKLMGQLGVFILKLLVLELEDFDLTTELVVLLADLGTVGCFLLLCFLDLSGQLFYPFLA